MSAYQLIRRAVAEKKIVVATYKNCRRWMCPHIIGKNRLGREQALFYQFRGESDHGLGPDGSSSNWRCIPTDNLIDVSIISGEWHTAANHSRSQTCVYYIDAQVEI